MDVVVIFNGLGNQMSQYAFYLKKKALKNNSEFVVFCNDHNGLELDRIFKIDCSFTLKRKLLYLIFRILLTEKFYFIISPIKCFLHFIGCKIIRENFNYNYNPNFLNSYFGINFYFGGWHSDLYFSSEAEKIQKDFSFNPVLLNNVNKSYLDLINKTNSVSLHIRRGDFLIGNNVNLFGNICTNDYYNLAITESNKYIETPHYFVFSNDMDWVKSNISLKNVTYVEGNNGLNSWVDLYLMSSCKNNIIANSSFSWWGAWLNSNPQKIVLCPSKFTNNDINSDVYPVGWFKINV